MEKNRLNDYLTNYKNQLKKGIAIVGSTLLLSYTLNYFFKDHLEIQNSESQIQFSNITHDCNILAFTKVEDDQLKVFFYHTDEFKFNSPYEPGKSINQFKRLEEEIDLKNQEYKFGILLYNTEKHRDLLTLNLNLKGIQMVFNPIKVGILGDDYKIVIDLKGVTKTEEETKGDYYKNNSI